eukprot:3459930-Amphidinium_carterae.1
MTEERNAAGQHQAGVFSDCSKCYERVHLRTLEAFALESGYPVHASACAGGTVSGFSHWGVACTSQGHACASFSFFVTSASRVAESPMICSNKFMAGEAPAFFLYLLLWTGQALRRADSVNQSFSTSACVASAARTFQIIKTSPDPVAPTPNYGF